MEKWCGPSKSTNSKREKKQRILGGAAVISYDEKWRGRRSCDVIGANVVTIVVDGANRG